MQNETPLQTEDFTEATDSVETPEESKRFLNRFQTARTACKSTFERLANDFKEAKGNPFIRSTSSLRYDVYRNASETEPIDSFVFEKSNACSLRALTIAAAILAAANIAVQKRFKK